MGEHDASVSDEGIAGSGFLICIYPSASGEREAA